MNVREFIKNNILLFDGAMGTMLQQRGLKIGENPEIFGFKNPDKLMEIHSLYLDAGSNVITTNTFGANELKLDKLGYTVEEIIDNAVNIAKKTIENNNVIGLGFKYACDNKENINEFISLFNLTIEDEVIYQK